MTKFTKLFDPFFETNKEQQTAFDSRFNNFYDKDSFQWRNRSFSFLPKSESLKIQALYSKLTPYFECTGLVHISDKQMRLVKKDIFEQKQDVSHGEIAIDISAAPCFEWIQISSARKHSLLNKEFGINESYRFQILVYKLSSDYALLAATAQAAPWLKIKLDAFAEQIALGYCDNE